MKVAFDAEPAGRREKTGHGYYVAGLLDALIAEESVSGVKITALAPKRRKDNLNTFFRLIWDQIGLPLLAAQNQANILHTTAFSVSLFSSQKKVATVHDLSLLLFPENLAGVSGWFLRRFVPWSYRFADRLIAVSEATKADLVRLLKISPQKISVVCEGVSDFYSPAPVEEKSAVLKKFGLAESKFMLFVGTLEPRKNLPFLIEAAAPVLQAHSDFKLVLAGKPGWQTEIKLSPAILKLGYVTDLEKRALYSSALCFCYPSKYEGFGLPILEAFACGCPVIAADNSSLPEVAGAAGAVLPPVETKWTEEIEKLISDSKYRGQKIKAGKERAKEFSWKNSARKTVAVYKQVYRDSKN